MFSLAFGTMATHSCSACGSGTSSIPHPRDSTSDISSGYLTPQRRNIYVPPSKRGTLHCLHPRVV
jgi:hypothetical protein